MATRNRTALFKQYRNSFQDRNGRRGPNFSASAMDDGIEMGGPEAPPYWVVYCSEAEKDMALIKDQMPELEKLHKSALVDFSDDMDTEHEIELLTGRISEIFQHCQLLIRKIGHPPKGTKETPDQTKLRHNAQISLATSLQDLSQEFRKTQSNYLKRLQGTETRNREALAGNQLLSNDDYDDFDTGFNDDQMMILQNAEEMAAEREREITKIAQSINDLAQIFKEMHILVIDQGTILDRIDYNIEKVVTYTEEAHTDLVAADKSQKSYRKKLCILLLIVVVVALILFLVARPKGSGGTTPTPTPGPGGNRTLHAFGFEDW